MATILVILMILSFNGTSDFGFGSVLIRFLFSRQQYLRYNSA